MLEAGIEVKECGLVGEPALLFGYIHRPLLAGSGRL